MGHVFLSYARPDRGIAKRAADALIEAGFEVWWDDQLPAHRAFHEVIDERLHLADSVLVLWSHASAKSDWVRAEADFARTHDKLIQARIDGGLPPMPFNQLQCVTLADWKGDAHHAEWRKVLEGLRAVARSEPRRGARSGAPQGARSGSVRWTIPVLGIVVTAAAIYAVLSATVSSLPPEQTESSHSAAPRIAVLPFEPIGTNPKASEFAAALADTVVGSLSDHLMQTLAIARAGEFVGDDRLSRLQERGIDLVLGGSVRAIDDRLVVRAYFEEVGSQLTIWSSQFERRLDEEGPLRVEVAVSVTETAYTVAEALEQRDSGLDTQGLSLYLKIADALKNPGRESGQRMLLMTEALVRQAPRFAGGHAYLALTLAESDTTRDDARTRLQRARREADEAIALHPATGPAYDALFFITRTEAPTDLVRAERELMRGLAGAPQFPFLHMRRCEFLMAVGRIRNAVEYCQQAAALRPLGPPAAFRRVLALWIAGDNEGAMTAFERAATNHPNHNWVNILRFEMLAAEGRVHDAAAMLTMAATRPSYASPANVPVLNAYLAALDTRSTQDVDTAVEKLLTAASTGTLDLLVAARYAATLDRTDAALWILARNRPGDRGYFMFHPALRSVHRDPRFMALAARTGHVAYWQATGTWPDYCADPTLPYRCEKEAAMAMAGE